MERARAAVENIWVRVAVLGAVVLVGTWIAVPHDIKLIIQVKAAYYLGGPLLIG